jgi:hypothetical protein
MKPSEGGSMHFLAVLVLFIFVSCAHKPLPPTKPVQHIAHDSMAQGNVTASAVKMIRQQNVCFDITLMMKGVEQRIAAPANWTLAWVDHKERYHLLSLNQRDPASIPKGANKEWKNTFRTCAPRINLIDVQSLVLTPKELPYKEAEGMRLKWE